MELQILTIFFLVFTPQLVILGVVSSDVSTDDHYFISSENSHFLKMLERRSIVKENSTVLESGWDQDNKIHEVTHTLNKLMINYDKRVRPYFDGPPVRVGVTLFVKNLASVSEVDMELQVDIYFRQYWKDPRLKFNLTRPGSNGSQVKVIGLTLEFAREIWQPDTYFPNEKMSFIHSATVENQFFRLFSNGQILKSTRLTLVSACPMSLIHYPQDQQKCSIQFGSYGYSTTDIVFFWFEGNFSVQVADDSLDLPQFNVKGHRQRMRTSETSTGNYSVLYCEFLFERYLNYYLAQVYVPAALVVVISWFSQWMERAGAERTALGVTSVLTITTLLMSTNANSPKISYIKALDIYLAVCFTMVFASLLHSATVGYLLKKTRTLKHDPGQQNQSQSYSPRDDNESHEDSGQPANCCQPVSSIFKTCSIPKCQNCHCGHRNVKNNGTVHIARLDIIARLIFPLTFTSFNIVYWAYYLNVKRLDEDDDDDWHLNKWGGA